MRPMRMYIKIVLVFLCITVVSAICMYAAPMGSGIIPYAAALNFLAGNSILYTICPPALAVVEHAVNRPIAQGDCRVKNLIPTGRLVVGYASAPGIKSQYHVRGYAEDGGLYDRTCPGCSMGNPDIVLTVRDFSVTDTKFHTFAPQAVAAYAYLRTALIVKKLNPLK